MKVFLCFVVSSLMLSAQVRLTQASDHVRIEINGEHFSDFIFGGDTTKPYLHPLRSASGKQITRSFPMDLVEGDKQDHPHHRGLWFTHGAVNGWDFWANEKYQKGVYKGRGEVKTLRVHSVQSGKESGKMSSSHVWIDGKGKKLLAEERTMTFYADPKLRTMDFDITLKALETVVFGDTKEGTFAIRLTRELEEDSTGKMTNAQGEVSEDKVWGSRSPWVDYAGTLQGEKLGVAILDHPTNPRHPTHWHSRAYGLFAANIFGLHDFYEEEGQDGSLELKPGGTLRFRYRVVIHPGDSKSFDTAAAFKQFAATK
jgi:hypothetical protein